MSHWPGYLRVCAHTVPYLRVRAHTPLLPLTWPLGLPEASLGTHGVIQPSAAVLGSFGLSSRQLYEPSWKAASLLAGGWGLGLGSPWSL